MKKFALTLVALLATLGLSAQTIDSTKAEKEEKIEKTSYYTGNLEFIAGSNKKINGEDPKNTYFRNNAFFGFNVGKQEISGYNWVEVYKDGTIFGRNTLSTTIVGGLGLENQLIYFTSKQDNNKTELGINTGIGIDYTFKPTEKSLVKPYFTPVLIDEHGKIVENTSITGIYAEAQLTDKLKVSGFGEINLTAKVDANNNGTTNDDRLKPTWSYGEVCAAYAVTPNITVEYVPSLTCKGAGVPEPKVNHRAGIIINF